MVLYPVRRESPLEVCLFTLKFRPRQIDDVFVASLKEGRLDSKLVSINAHHPFVPVRFGGPDVRTDVAVISRDILDLSRREVCQVNRGLSAIKLFASDE